MYTLSAITMWRQTFFFIFSTVVLRNARSSRPRVWPSATERRRRQVHRGAERYTYYIYTGQFRIEFDCERQKRFPITPTILIGRIRSVSESFVDSGSFIRRQQRVYSECKHKTDNEIPGGSVSVVRGSISTTISGATSFGQYTGEQYGEYDLGRVRVSKYRLRN